MLALNNKYNLYQNTILRANCNGIYCAQLITLTKDICIHANIEWKFIGLWLFVGQSDKSRYKQVLNQ